MMERKSETREFKSGFTWRSYLAILYAIFIYTPAVIWLSLVTVGIRLVVPITLSTLILFVEFARISGKPLSKHESFIIMSLTGQATGIIFTNLIYRLFFVHSDIAEYFKIADKVPYWWAPPRSSSVWIFRTFLHADWIIPITIALLANILSIISGLSLGLFARELFIEKEGLPFPMQQVHARAVITLTEREEESMNIFAVTTIIGFIYGLILYAIPFVSEAMGVPGRFIPIPWFDFWYYVQRFFPGASFGIGTDILLIVSGLVLPFPVVLGMFIGSFFIYFIANWLLVHFGWTLWATRYTPGMNIRMILRESTLSWLAMPLIGIGIAAGLLPIFLRARDFSSAVRSMFQSKIDESEVRISGARFSIRLALLFFFASAAGATVLLWVLIPDAPIWFFLPLIVIWPIIDTLISVRMIGVTGVGFDIPYLTQMAIYSSGYKGYDLWFAPIIITEGTQWCVNFKMCQLTETSIISYLKAWVLTMPLSIIVSFISVSVFWNIAPIPSA
ncbi:TPA: hypothetical protein EYP75_04050, partial [Candidatus Bathyarchaeota archaeon]|nr:hypothetical protein [Candidatus Bathyarchaeota archaeon]